MPGVVNVVPVPSDTPPVDAAYQLIIPADAVAPRVIDPVPQFDPGVVVTITGIVFTVIETLLGALVPQPFVAVTLKVPEVAVRSNPTVTELDEPVIVAPPPL